MGKAPAFQFYANDFMDATSTWPAIAVGLYVRCLCKQWTNGSVPADLKTIARATHCDFAEVQEAWPLVGKKFIDQGDGTLKNKRLEEVRARQIEVSEERSKAGKAGAIARANVKANASTNAKQRKVKEKEKVEREVEGEVETLIWPTFKDWFDMYDKRRDKDQCETEWAKLDQAMHELIYRHTEQYVKAQPDKLYRKDPIRYLKKKGWNDEVITAKTNTNGPITEDARQERRRLVVEANAKFYRERDAANGDQS